MKIKSSIITFVKNKYIKSLLCIGCSFIISLSLFYFMSSLISDTPDLSSKKDNIGMIEFIRIKPRTRLDEKTRKLPPKKTKKIKQPKMNMLSLALSKPTKPKSILNSPNLHSLVKSSGPAVGGLGNNNFGSGITPLIRMEAQYPIRATRQGIEGWVILQFDITRIGRVSNIKILDYKPSPIFNKSSIKALRKWKYRPKMEDGKAVRTKNIKVKLEFTLKK